MARRILSAETALMPQSQHSLSHGGVRPEPRGGLLGWLQERWSHVLSLREHELLFDWEDRTALMQEIAFLNESREKLDEAAAKLAPSMLRIVLTVKAHVAGTEAQRAFLAEHLDWDFRRVSELCLVAERYGLLEPERREAGRRELSRYGWSCALKLAYVAEPGEREDLWERACNGKPRATYRALLEELRRFRERKLIGPPPSVRDVGSRLLAASRSFEALHAAAHDLSSSERYRDVLSRVSEAQRELRLLRRTLVERMEANEVESYAASA